MYVAPVYPMCRMADGTEGRKGEAVKRVKVGKGVMYDTNQYICCTYVSKCKYAMVVVLCISIFSHFVCLYMCILLCESVYVCV